VHRILAAILVVLTMLALPPRSAAGLLSKSYVYKPGVTLELGVASEEGLRVDSVHFRAPSGGSALMRTGDRMSVEIAVSNTSAEPLKVGLAVALFDQENRLLGVASGGTKLVPIKTGRQKRYTLVFDHVNSEAPRAATFQLSMESKR
jgi:hypothetical protein